MGFKMLDLTEEQGLFEEHMRQEFGPRVDLRIMATDRTPVRYINRTIEADWRAWLERKLWQPPPTKQPPHTHR